MPSYTAEFRTDVDFATRILPGVLATGRAEKGPRLCGEPNR